MQQKTGLLPFVRPVTLQAKQAGSPSTEDHDARNTKLGRPLSPHLTVYKFELPAIMSISHRISGTVSFTTYNLVHWLKQNFVGMVLTGYAAGLGLAALALPPESISHSIDSLASLQLGSAVLVLGKFVLAFPLTYHFWNGIRHLCWDLGKFFTLKEIYLTGWVVFSIAVGSAGALAVL